MTGTDQILLGQLYRWRGSFEYEHESAVNTHGWCYVAGFAGPQIRPGSCKAAWSVPDDQGRDPAQRRRRRRRFLLFLAAGIWSTLAKATSRLRP